MGPYFLLYEVEWKILKMQRGFSEGRCLYLKCDVGLRVSQNAVSVSNMCERFPNAIVAICAIELRSSISKFTFCITVWAVIVFRELSH